MADARSKRGLIIAAPGSGSGKTIITLGLIAALRARGQNIAAAKTGPDYIDTAFLSLAAGRQAVNLDPWAMSQTRLRSRAFAHVKNAEILLIEGVMGLFDGAANGSGSTGDLAAILGLPVVLVVDAARQSQSVGALVSGFANWRDDVCVAGIILNNVGTDRHEKLLRGALEQTSIPVLGCLPRVADLQVPDRHLGLVLPGEVSDFSALLQRAGKAVATHCDLDAIGAIAKPLPANLTHKALAPLGQHIAIARDQAFAFIYQHWLNDWRQMGAEISFFSPLADEVPDKRADAIFLPGGYPELHGEKLSDAGDFISAMQQAQIQGKLIYGECGGYMVLGKTLTDQQGRTCKMSGVLPHHTSMDRPRRVLGYRHLSHTSVLPWPTDLMGHEFHYSSSSAHQLPPLFTATDALGLAVPDMGCMSGCVMGSYAHIIDAKHTDTPVESP